jgi:hypothetical protein
MDPLFLPAIIEQALPAVVAFIVFGTPVALVYMLRSFRLREKELDVRRALAERPRDAEIVALEERVARLEHDRRFYERLVDRAAEPAARVGSPPARRRVAPSVTDAPAEPLELEAEFEAIAVRTPVRDVRAL